MKRTFLTGVAAGALVLLAADPALASWRVAVPASRGYVAARTVPAGGTPTGHATGSSIALSWPAATVAPGVPVAGYAVRRYDSSSGVSYPVGTGCAGTVAGTGCTETGVPDGGWKYTVRPVYAGWSGSESAASGAVTVFTVAAATAVNFPGSGQTYDTAGFNAGCGTPGGDLCGTATASGGWTLMSVKVSLRQGTGAYWDPATSGFTSGAEKLFTATGTSTWSVPFAASSFSPNGSYTLRAVSTDNLGRTTSASSTFTALVSPPPAPAITSQPAARTNSTSATFAFTDAQSGVTFQCSRDGAAYTPCTSPTGYTGLATGTHTFSVKAKDAFGVLSPATTTTWVIDRTAPTADDVQTTNGGTAGRVDTGDKLIVTFSEPMDPGTVQSGWTGAATAVTVHVGDGASNDTLTVTGTALGSVKLGNGYAAGSFDATATMEMVGSTVVVTITQTDPNARTGSASKMVWTPDGTLSDLAGNGITGGSVTESGGTDLDF